MARVPTHHQYCILRALGSGGFLVAGKKREVEPLLRRGWVVSRPGWAWVQITPDGLRALADAAEKYGLPELPPQKPRPVGVSAPGRA